MSSLIDSFKGKMNENVKIRWVKMSDASAVLNFRRAVCRESRFLITKPDEVGSFAEQRRHIALYLSDPKRIFLIAHWNSESDIVGIVTLAGFPKRKIAHVAELGISVRKDYWGMGIGSRLMYECLREAKERAFKKIQLEVMVENNRAISLYKKFGFTEEGLKKRSVFDGNTYSDLLLMGLWLGDK